MLTRRLTLDPHHPDPGILAAAAAELRRGALVAFPTETVYGLGVDPRQPSALERLKALKDREAAKPFALLLAEPEWAWQLSPTAPALARALAERFWPGPLTLVLPGAEPEGIGCRIPNLRLTIELLRLTQGPLATPSANRAGERSPVNADEVARALEGEIELILDGGECGVGLESTVLDLRGPRPQLRRPGGITIRELRRVAPEVLPLPPSERQPRFPIHFLAPGEEPPVGMPRLNWGDAPAGSLDLGADPLLAARELWPTLRRWPPGAAIATVLPPADSPWEALRERLLWAAGLAL